MLWTEPFAESNMKFLRALLLTSLFVLGVQPSVAANKKHQKAETATFLLYGRSASANRDHVPICTAFVYKKVSDGYNLLTAGHCFVNTGAPADVQYFVVPGQVVDGSYKGEDVEVLGAVDDGKMDVAELHLKTNKKYSVLELDNKLPKIDDKVFFVGYPAVVSQVVMTGRVESEVLRSNGPRNDCGICEGRILVQIGGAGGASGSPVISEKTGKVVGILEGHAFENGVLIVPASDVHVYLLRATLPKYVPVKNESGEGDQP